MTKKTFEELAAQYGLTVDQLRAAQMEFLQCEGCHDDGHESATFHEWMAYKPRQEAKDPEIPMEHDSEDQP